MEKEKKLSGDERRAEIIKILSLSSEAVSGSKLSKLLNVSRQVIVTDIALLRVTRNDLISTNSGYLLSKSDSRSSCVRIFKVSHTDEQIEDELSSIVDFGGKILDVFIQHKVYGTLSASLNISCKRDIQNFLCDLKSGVSTPLKNITSNFHYHTVEAKNENVLDEIENMLKQKKYLIETNENATVYESKNYSLV